MTVCDVCSANVERRRMLHKVLEKLPTTASEERQFILNLWQGLLAKYNTMACTSCARKTAVLAGSVAFPQVPNFPPGKQRECNQCEDANRALQRLSLHSRKQLRDSDVRACNACVAGCTSKYCQGLGRVTQYLAQLQIKELPQAKPKAKAPGKR